MNKKKSKRWYEQYYPIGIVDPPNGAIRHNKFNVMVLKQQKRQQAKCKPGGM